MTKIQSHQINSPLKRFRISVKRSNRYVSAQIIDDATSSTVVAVTENETKSAPDKKEQVMLAAQILAQKSLAKKITHVYFDRRTYKYHGRVSAFADELRKQGLLF
ncbi:50S ribosomal protein L18 [Candidatus Berkelbacteria bacterium]|nr:50S ribosomal protein L18 [Candidatus Berkelbacteria bacterium]